jgi:hypothetical protein
MIDDDIAALEHLAQVGMGRTALPLPASVGFAAKFVVHHLLDPAIRRHGGPTSRAVAQRRTRRGPSGGAIKLRHAAWSEWFASLFSPPA